VHNTLRQFARFVRAAIKQGEYAIIGGAEYRNVSIACLHHA
jgi:hypothetical protein